MSERNLQSLELNTWHVLFLVFIFNNNFLEFKLPKDLNKNWHHYQANPQTMGRLEVRTSSKSSNWDNIQIFKSFDLGIVTRLMDAWTKLPAITYWSIVWMSIFQDYSLTNSTLRLCSSGRIFLGFNMHHKHVTQCPEQNIL